MVPVYRGEHCLGPLVEELAALTEGVVSPGGTRWRVTEVILVHDCGPDRSDVVIRVASARHDVVRPIWLSRNFGQHAATLAGMASTAAPWVVTVDEDGQHDPAEIGVLLDAAFAAGAPLVYGASTQGAAHPLWRNATSQGAKRLVEIMSGVPARQFSSFRLILGEHARAVAAYCGQGIYLDVALSWVVPRSTGCAVVGREERRAASGYSLKGLLRHFSSLVLSSATRPLRVVALIGIIFSVLGAVGGAWIVLHVVFGGADDVPGWASVSVILLVTMGAVLFSLGVIAEYIGSILRLGLGRPLYVMVNDPAFGPLGSREAIEDDRG